MTLTAEELSVTPSAVSHRVRQLEQVPWAHSWFRPHAIFRLTTDGQKYLQQVREGLGALQCFSQPPRSPAAAPA